MRQANDDVPLAVLLSGIIDSRGDRTCLSVYKFGYSLSRIAWYMVYMYMLYM